MRWPWEWGRRADATNAGAGDVGDPSRGPAGPPGSAGPAELPATPNGPRAWTSLPPLQRSVADKAPSVAPPDGFRASLTTHQNPSFLAPLGHLVDRDGPSGVVEGLAPAVGEPISYESGGVELRVPDSSSDRPAPAVQRQVADLRPEPEPEPEPTVADDHRATSEAPTPASSPLLAERPVATEHTELAETPDAQDPRAAAGVRPNEPAAGPPLVVARQIDPSASPSAKGSPATPFAASGVEVVAIQRSIGANPGHDQSGHDQSGHDHPGHDHPGHDHAAGSSGGEYVGQWIAPAADRPDPAVGPVVQRSSPAETPPDSAVFARVEPAAARETEIPVLGSRPEATAAREPPVRTSSVDTPETGSMPTLAVPVQRLPIGSAAPTSQPPAAAAPRLIVTREASAPVDGNGATPPVQRLASEPTAPGSPAVPDPLGSRAAQPDAAPPVPDLPERETPPDQTASLDPVISSGESGVPSENATAGSTEAPTSGLLADHAPLISATQPRAAGDEPASTTPADPLIVASHVPDPGGTVQRLSSTQPQQTSFPSTSAEQSGPQAIAPSTDSSWSIPGPATPARPAADPTAAHEQAGLIVPPAPVGASVAPTAPDADHVDYPPLVARSVQRHKTEAESSGSTDRQAPLSGFAAAISALNSDSPAGSSDSATGPAAAATGAGVAGGAAFDGGGSGSRSSGLVVARQVATTPAPPRPGTTAGLPPALTRTNEPSVATSAGRPVPDLVVARRVAPDRDGNLPIADARLSPSGPPPGPRGADPDDHSTRVQRSLLADQQPLLAVESSPGWGESAPSAPAVQRIRYDELSAPTEHRAPTASASDRGATASAARGPAPTVQRAGASAANVPSAGSAGASRWARSDSTVAPAPLGSLGSLGPLGPLGSSVAMDADLPARAAPPSRESYAGEAVQRLPEDTPHRVGEARNIPLSPVQRTTSPSPAPPAEMVAMVQRRFETPPVPTSPPAPAPAPEESAAGVSSRTVGLAEMFALASAQGDAATVQRSSDGMPAPGETEVQLESATPSSPSTSSAAPAAAPAAAAPSGAELDEMARRLYEPLTARLRAELWQDRERSGLLTDLRP